MAAYTSSQAGNWSATAVWSGTGPPGNGDTATVNHAVTVDVNTTVGTSPASGGTTALTVGATGSLTVATGVVFKVRGPVAHDNAPVTVNDGGVIELDASQATDPTNQHYAWASNGATHHSCALVLNGTAEIRSNASGGNGYVNFGGFRDSGTVRFNGTSLASPCKVTRLGTASNDAISTRHYFGNATTPANAVDTVGWVLFDSCNGVNAVYAQAEAMGGTDGGYRFGASGAVVRFTNTVASYCFKSLSAGRGANQVEDLEYTAFDKPIKFNTYVNNINDCYLKGQNGGIEYNDTANAPASFKRNLVHAYTTGGTAVQPIVMYGDSYDCYLFADDGGLAGNPHTFSIAASSKTVDGWVVEYPWNNIADGGDFGFLATGATNCVMTRCLVLPCAGDGDADMGMSTNLANIGSGSSWASITHCTFHAGKEGGVATGDFTGAANLYAAYKSNLGWVGNTFTTAALGPYHAYSAHNAGNPTLDTQDMLTSAGIKNNYGWNLQAGFAGKGFNTNQSANPDATNTLTSGGTGPDFVDSTRNLQNWAVFKGAASSGDSQATKVAAGLALLAGDPRLIYQDANSLVKWVRNGFRPRNTALKNAGHDSVTIGALEGVWPSGGKAGVKTGGQMGSAGILVGGRL